jgi:hypothetical protein
VTVQEPIGITIGGEIAQRRHLRHSDRGLIRDKQVEWQRGECA